MSLRAVSEAGAGTEARVRRSAFAFQMPEGATRHVTELRGLARQRRLPLSTLMPGPHWRAGIDFPAPRVPEASIPVLATRGVDPAKGVERCEAMKIHVGPLYRTSADVLQAIPETTGVQRDSQPLTNRMMKARNDLNKPPARTTLFLGATNSAIRVSLRGLSSIPDSGRTRFRLLSAGIRSWFRKNCRTEIERGVCGGTEHVP